MSLKLSHGAGDPDTPRPRDELIHSRCFIVATSFTPDLLGLETVMKSIHGRYLLITVIGNPQYMLIKIWAKITLWTGYIYIYISPPVEHHGQLHPFSGATYQDLKPKG